MERTTAYPESEGGLAWRLTGGTIDHASLERPLARCDLRQCRGMCCHDGVYLSDEMADHLERLVVEEEAFFREIGLDLPDRPIVPSEHGDPPVRKTATKPCDFRRTVPGYPAHFNDAACVFHLDDGRCGLQALSEARGLHPWHHKPTPCWLHPLQVDTVVEGEPATVRLESEADERTRLEGPPFVNATFCGRTDPAGRPAETVLAEELRAIGEFGGLTA